MRFTRATAQGIKAALRRDRVLREISFGEINKKRLLKKKLSFGPDLCLADGRHYHLVYALGLPRIPDWVRSAHKQLTAAKRISAVIVATDSPEVSATDIAEAVAEECYKLGFGLLLETSEGLLRVWPPDYAMPKLRRGALERGHIPAATRKALLNVRGFSPYLMRRFELLDRRYTPLLRSLPSYDDESDLLITLAREIRSGDRRLFFPIGLFQTLQDWERAGANEGARDHFFHTFNNLLNGFLVLGGMLEHRARTELPDRYIADPKRISKLHLWESLWSLTCMFHDPGYMGEDFWRTFAFSIGSQNRSDQSNDVPSIVLNAINNAWHTEFLEAREDLVKLFTRVSDAWRPAGFGDDVVASFDPALRRAYFDGRRCGHSLISGLYLITRCRRDRAAKHELYDPEISLKACIIAALSMMFHDQHTRDTLCSNGIPSIPFEQLPYAATLMFTDALQDDRRDITCSEFPRAGVLEGIAVNSVTGAVTATVCLPRVPLRYWPAKIAEIRKRLAVDQSGVRYKVRDRLRQFCWALDAEWERNELELGSVNKS